MLSCEGVQRLQDEWEMLQNKLDILAFEKANGAFQGEAELTSVAHIQNSHCDLVAAIRIGKFWHHVGGDLFSMLCAV